MNLLKLFQTKSKSFYLFLILLGIISSLTNLGILMQVNIALGGRSFFYFGQYNYVAFSAMIIISFFTSLFFQTYMAELTNNIMYSLELSIVEKVRNASFSSFDKLGSNKIYAAIADARILSRVPETFVTIVNSIVTLTCSLVYLFWISFWSGVFILGLMVVLVLIYLYRNNKIEKDLNKVRDLQDSYYASLRELLGGFKQVRISSLRNKNIFEKFIFINRNKAKVLSVSVSKRYIVNELIGVYSWFFVLAVIIFILPVVFKISVHELAVFITTILFMMSPVAQLIIYVPSLTSFKISLDRINRIDKELIVDSLPAVKVVPEQKDFESIRFENVLYKYSKDEKTTFQLELPDFKISKGETIFVIGGNGSGKTTFISLLTGLCRSESGKIYIDDKEIDWAELSSFSNNMAVVYSDHYLFSENYDEHDLSGDNSLKDHFVDMLNLKGIVKMNEAKKNFDNRLSKGQQKRLALLLALLENKPIVILDEWAAEQDPANRRQFYSEWLPIMKAMGKTIIAVSHDDDYYHTADRVVKFNYGKITSDAALTVETV
jgi:cyclic peptide transporter